MKQAVILTKQEAEELEWMVKVLIVRWFYDHQILFTLHFTVARELSLSEQVRAFWNIWRVNRDLTDHPQIHLGAVHFRLGRNLRKAEQDRLEEQVGQRPADPLTIFRLLTDLTIPFRIAYHPCFGVERDSLKEDLTYNWHCFRFIRTVRHLQQSCRKQTKPNGKENQS